MFAIKNKEDQWFAGLFWGLSNPVRFSSDQMFVFNSRQEAVDSAAEIERIASPKKIDLSIVELEVRTVTPF